MTHIILSALQVFTHLILPTVQFAHCTHGQTRHKQDKIDLAQDHIPYEWTCDIGYWDSKQFFFTLHKYL